MGSRHRLIGSSDKSVSPDEDTTSINSKKSGRSRKGNAGSLSEKLGNEDEVEEVGNEKVMHRRASSIYSVLEMISVAEGDIFPDTPAPSHESIKKRTFWDRFRGILFGLLATFLIGLQPSIFYYGNQIYKMKQSPSCFLAWTYLIYTGLNSIPVGLLLYYNAEGLFKPLRDRPCLICIFVLRGICGSFVPYSQWWALKFFQRPAPAAVICAMAPIFVYINAYLVLREKLGWIPIINAFVALGGVLVMNIEGFSGVKDPLHSSSSDAFRGTLVALGGMFCLSWSTVLMRILKDVNPILVSLSFGMCGVIFQTIIAASTGTLEIIRDPIVWGLSCASALVAVISNLLLNLALVYEQAGVISLVRTTDVIFNFLNQFAFFFIPPRLYDLLGALLIIFGVICVTLRKIVQEEPEDSKLRKYLFFLLY